MVEGPSSGLDQVSLRFRKRHLEALAHRPGQPGKGKRERFGYDFYTDYQDIFRRRGDTAIIAGKPDFIGEMRNEILISDANTKR